MLPHICDYCERDTAPLGKHFPSFPFIFLLFSFKWLNTIPVTLHISRISNGANLFCFNRYGLIWISTTLVFVLSSLGNLATYLMEKQTDKSTSWSFDVSYVNVAACSIYGYTIVIPLAYYFLLQYMGSNSSLIRFWCMWGYSLAIFVPSSVSLFLLQFSLTFFPTFC